MLPKETLELVIKTVLKSQKPEVFTVPGIDHLAFIQQGETLRTEDLPPPRRSHLARSLDDLVAVVTGVGPRPVIWHDENHVVGLFDEGDRRDRVTFFLQKTGVFGTLEGLPGDPLTHDALVRLLRIDLGKCCPPEVLRLVRTLNVRTVQQVASDVQQGANRLGKDIEAAVTGTDKLPDDIDMQVEVYGNVDLEAFKLTVALEINAMSPGGPRFNLAPLDDGVSRAVADAQRQIGKKLVELLVEREDLTVDVPVYFGTP